MTNNTTDLLDDSRPYAVTALTPPLSVAPPRLLAALRALADPPPEPEVVENSTPLTIGPYRVICERGRGGMGVVFEAVDDSLNRQVAVKVLTAGAFADSTARERFMREARTAAAVRHDHLVPVYAAESPADGPPYLVMPFIDGPTIAELVRKTSGVSPSDAARYARDIADALSALHTVGVIHRDVKPGNILLDSVDGRAKLTDFGLARGPKLAAVTTLGVVAGTPGYLSPEQITRPDAVDGRSDVYSLGASLYEMLAGVPPFRGNTLDLMRAVVDHDPIAPRHLNPSTPVDLQTVCLKCLAKEPAQRYQSATALRDDLDRFLTGLPVTARPLGAIARCWRYAKRNPMLVGLWGTLALVVIVGVASAVVLWLQAEASATLASARQREAEIAADRELTQRKAAEANLDTALEAVDRFYLRTSEDDFISMPGAQPMRTKLLTDAVEFYKRFVAARRDDPRAAQRVADSLSKLSTVQLSLGETEQAIASREEAMKAHTALQDEPLVAEDGLRLAECYFNARRYSDAVTAGNDASRRFTSLVESDPSPRFRRRRAEAELILGWAYMQLKSPDYEVHFHHAVTMLEQLVNTDFDSKRLLATALSAQATMRMIAEDLPALERVRRLRSEVLAVHPDNHAFRADLAQANLNVGVLYKWGGRTTEAVAAYRAAATELGHLVEDNPKVVAWRRNLARTQFNLAELHLQQGQYGELLNELRSSCGHFDRLVGSGTPDIGLLLESGTAHAKLGFCLSSFDRPGARNELNRATLAANTLEHARNLTPIQHDRLTRELVGLTVRGWLAAGEPIAANDLATAHTTFVKSSPVTRKTFFRLRAEAAQVNGPDALLAVVNEWIVAFADDSIELGDAGQICTNAINPTRQIDPLRQRAQELFEKAEKARNHPGKR